MSSDKHHSMLCAVSVMGAVAVGCTVQQTLALSKLFSTEKWTSSRLWKLSADIGPSLWKTWWVLCCSILFVYLLV